jgi:hypothetical protein
VPGALPLLWKQPLGYVVLLVVMVYVPAKVPVNFVPLKASAETVGIAVEFMVIWLICAQTPCVTKGMTISISEFDAEQAAPLAAAGPVPALVTQALPSK